MTEQRLAGLSHQELYALAHGGDPAATTTSQNGFTRLARTLRNVSDTLSAPLSGLDADWQGPAADAARAGIGEHAQWARAAAGRADLAASEAAQQVASAQNVINTMPAPQPAPGPGANLAEAEQSQANARQRALELMEHHADVCGQLTPVNGFGQPPRAGATPSGARPAGAAEPGGPAERVRPAGGRGTREPTLRTAATGEPRPGAGTPGEVDEARPVRAITHAEPRAGADALDGPSYLSERTEHGFPGSREALVADPVMASVEPVLGGRSRYQVRQLAPTAAAGQSPAQPSPPRHPRPEGPHRIDRHPSTGRQVSGLRQPDHERLDAGQPSHGLPDSGQPGGPGSSGVGPGGGLPPMVGGTGTFDAAHRHRAPDYLLDEVDLFDGRGWVTLPVIGR
jgi:hypothetical protein